VRERAKARASQVLLVRGMRHSLYGTCPSFSHRLQRNFEGRLVGSDKFTDLAVLKVEAPSELLRRLPVGTARSLKVGQRVLAIGNPFGFDHTLTAGIVSGLNRDIFSETGVVIGGGIQTDASINPGNSGGPLLDSRGRLVGVNTAIFTRSGTSSGVGFAISADTVERTVPQLIEYGKVVRPGLNVQLAAQSIAAQLGVKSGALILQVPADSVAARAGLQPTRRSLTGISLGDVIVAINGLQVGTSADVGRILDTFRVGDEVMLRVLRGGQTVDVSLLLGEAKVA